MSRSSEDLNSRRVAKEREETGFLRALLFDVVSRFRFDVDLWDYFRWNQRRILFVRAVSVVVADCIVLAKRTYDQAPRNIDRVRRYLPPGAGKDPLSFQFPVKQIGWPIEIGLLYIAVHDRRTT